ncbi:MAG: SRPBCC family protein [Acidiferrobacterales bacterium]
MKKVVLNIHERLLHAPAQKAGDLINRLASPSDAMWPGAPWPPLRFNRALGVGAAGGHGPFRFFIEAYEPDLYISFRFTAPKGFIGTHYFQLKESTTDTVLLRHVLEMNVVGLARVSWPLIFRPCHDALLEAALDRAEAFIAGESSSPRKLPFITNVLILLLKWYFSWRRRKSISALKRKIFM